MKDQREKMRMLFESRPNQKIPLWEITRIAAQYNARISELRKDEDNPMNIVNHYEGTFEGVKHTSFEYLPVGDLFGDAGYSKREEF